MARLTGPVIVNFKSILLTFKSTDFSSFVAIREEEVKRGIFGDVTSSPGKAKNFKRRIVNKVKENSEQEADLGGGGIRFS